MAIQIAFGTIYAHYPDQPKRARCLRSSGQGIVRCRGRLKATMEATWACLTYNLMRWFGLCRALQAQPASIG